MGGGIHPPLEIMLSWPLPNETNPEQRSNAIFILALVGGPTTMLLLLVRLWVRIFHQRNPGWDDWIMLVAMIPTFALIVLFPIASSYGYSRHVWDYNPLEYPSRMVNARKYVLVIECVFCVSSGLIKISILLFYRRLSSRAISKPFVWITWATIVFISLYSVALTIVPIFGCRPISAFWNQVDLIKKLKGYKYECFNEGADVFAASVISGVQDLVTAILPSFLYYNLQVPIRQKFALFGIFALGYGVVALGGLRAYYSYYIFYLTYDVTWYTYDLMLITSLELQIGCFCANAPALKVFFKHFFSDTISSLSRSGRSSNARIDTAYNTSKSSSVLNKVASLLTSKSKSGYISEPNTHVSVDFHGGVQVQKEFQVTRSPPRGLSDKHNSTNSTEMIYGHYYGNIELPTRNQERASRMQGSPSDCGDEEETGISALPKMPSPPVRAKSPRLFRSSSITHAIPFPPSKDRSARDEQASLPKRGPSKDGRPNWQTWS